MVIGCASLSDYPNLFFPRPRTGFVPQHLLEEIAAVEGVVSSGLFDRDGLLLASSGSSPDVETWASQIAKMQDSSSEISAELELGEVQCVTVLGSEGSCICWGLQDSARIVLVLSKHVNLGAVRRCVQERLQRIESLL